MQKRLEYALEEVIQGRSRSVRMAEFDRPYRTSCQSASYFCNVRVRFDTFYLLTYLLWRFGLVVTRWLWST